MPSKLQYLLNPRSIAIVGASPRPESLINRLMVLLKKGGYQGDVYPINPKYEQVLDWRCYPSYEALPEIPDVAVISVSADKVKDLVVAGADAGVRNFVVLSASFAETGEEGLRLERELADLVRERNLQLLGPNSAGFVNYWERAIVTFSSVYDYRPLVPGPIGVVAQSGGLSTLIYDLCLRRGIGLSWLISSGNETALDAVDYAEHLIADPNTRVIAMYLEQTKRGRELMEQSRRGLMKGKPFVILKSGGTQAGRRAALSHTGSMVGDEQVSVAAFRQAGIIRAESVTDLAITAETLARVGDRRVGRRVAILAVSGGLGVVAADAAEAHGFEVPLLTDATRERLRELLPPFAGVNNPVDPTPAVFYDAERLQQVLTIVAEDPRVDHVVVVNCFDHHIGRAVADRVCRAAARLDILTSLIWLAGSQEMYLEVAKAGIPCYDEMAPAFQALAHVRDAQARQAVFMAGLKPGSGAPIPASAAFPTGGPTLTEDVIKAVLAQWDIPTVREVLVRTPEEAAAAAREMGVPVAVKVVSPDVAHKAKVGGVALGVKGADAVRAAAVQITQAVRQAYPHADLRGFVVQEMVPEGLEILVGMTRDPSFGPVLVCGAGGVHTETIRDMALRVLPIHRGDAEEMLGELRLAPMLEGRDKEGLINLLARVSDLCMAWGDSLRELDLNPVILGTDSLVVVDGLAVVDG